eukprot:GHVU01136977.1.p1 GENE.GHVU01136977.1~~GHVU01136977.1.p1  ORF type:complete len:212 (-),score=6.58 GHVU01136977.1:127-762(-)
MFLPSTQVYISLYTIRMCIIRFHSPVRESTTLPLTLLPPAAVSPTVALAASVDAPVSISAAAASCDMQAAVISLEEEEDSCKRVSVAGEALPLGAPVTTSSDGGGVAVAGEEDQALQTSTCVVAEVVDTDADVGPLISHRCLRYPSRRAPLSPTSVSDLLRPFPFSSQGSSHGGMLIEHLEAVVIQSLLSRARTALTSTGPSFPNGRCISC